MLLVLTLTACGGSGNTFNADPGTGGGGGDGDGGGTAATVSIGNCDLADIFTLAILSIGNDPLPASGTTSVQANLVENQDCTTPFATATSISFSSTCSGLDLATLDSPVFTASGVAISTYTDISCGDTDTITASATVNGTVINATGTITVAQASIGSVEFISATPQVIALSGTGGAGFAETSTVVFKVIDNTGASVAGQTVTFSLSTVVGGLSLTPATAITTADGLVQTIVSSGTVATVVEIKAKAVDPDSGAVFETPSSLLIVGTGIPDQDSFSLSVSSFNPEGANFDGATVTFTIRLADRYNNPVPDGTAVTFITEGGTIESFCTSVGDGVNSSCSVTWTSQNPVPGDCLSTIRAVAIGEESFTDDNSNAVFDDGETFFDIGETYIDIDFNGVYDAGMGELFIDFNTNGVRDGPNGLFTSNSCDDVANTMCDKTALSIFANAQIVMAESFPTISFTPSADPFDVSTGQKTLEIKVVGSSCGLIMPEGTTIDVSTTNGSIVGDSSFTVPNAFDDGTATLTEGRTTFTVTVKPDTTPDSGVLSVEVTTPEGFVTVMTIGVID